MKEIYSSDGRIRIDFEVRNDAVILYQYSKTRYGGWKKWSNIILPREMIRHLTPLALDGGDSAAFQALSTPEVLSTLQDESNPAHRK